MSGPKYGMKMNCVNVAIGFWWFVEARKLGVGCIKNDWNWDVV